MTSLQSLLQRVQKHERLFLMADFDGTLVPIVSRPDEVLVTEKLVQLLKGLSECSRVWVAVVSGRPFVELDRYLPVNGLTLVGGHGSEMRWADSAVQTTILSRTETMAFRALRAKLIDLLAQWPGCFLEEKPHAVALHFRLAPERVRLCVRDTLPNVIRMSSHQQVLELIWGRMVAEFRLNGVNKGNAVKTLLEHVSNQAPHPVYLGDDRTDDDAFRVIRRNGTTIGVGPTQYHNDTHFHLSGPEVVQDFLSQLLEHRLRMGGE